MNDPEATPKATRTQNPKYHVFCRQETRLRRTEIPTNGPADHGEIWEQLTDQPIAAGSRKQAVEAALAAEAQRGPKGIGEKEAEARQKGPFLVVPAKECWIKSRTTKTETTEVWS